MHVFHVIKVIHRGHVFQEKGCISIEDMYVFHVIKVIHRGHVFQENGCISIDAANFFNTFFYRAGHINNIMRLLLCEIARLQDQSCTLTSSPSAIP